MRKIRISRTESMRRNMLTSMKFIFGRRVKLGRVYNGCHLRSGMTAPDPYRAVSYDPANRLLMLKKPDAESYLVLEGDVVVWQGALYAEKWGLRFNLSEPVLVTIRNYMESHGISEVTDEVVAAAMKARYPKMPISRFKFLDSVY